MGLQETSKIAFILSLIGGVVMLIVGAISFLWFMSGGIVIGGMMGGFSGMMGGYHAMMGSLGVPLSFLSGFSLVGLVSGILVVAGAIMLNIRPAEHIEWGVVIVVFSIISFLGTGGFLIGAVLGTIGGTLAVSWRPS